MIVADAHQYLLDHFKEFDFIWSSPPCPSHSKARFWGFRDSKPIYPDMKLYEEIIFLKYYFDGKYCVENVNPYYKPMFNPQVRDRHTYWTNFILPNKLSMRNDTALVQASRMQDLCDFHDYNFNQYKGSQRVLKMARNLVDYEAGRTILETALGIIRKQDTKQTELF